jgi:hypothetical protein
MQMKVQLVGEEANEVTLFALQDWLKNSDIQGLVVEREKGRPREGEMGDWTAALALVLGSAAVVELVRSIHVWLQTRRRNMTFEFTIDGKVIKLEVENFADEKAIIRTVEKIIKAANTR